MATAPDLETIVAEIADDGIATVTLNRPRSLNAIDRRMADELVIAFMQLEADDRVRAVVLTGAGGHFSSGGDVSGQGDAPAADEAEPTGRCAATESCRRAAIV